MSNAHKQQIVMIHGWGYDSSVFKTLVETLKSNFRVQTVNLPGYNNTPAVSEYTLNKLALQIENQIGEDVTVIGWSMGGLVAMQLAELFPNKVTKLILLTSTPCFSRKETWTEAMDRKVLKNFLVAYNKQPKETLERFTYLTTEGSNNPRNWLRVLKKLTEVEVSQEALEKGLDLLINSDLRDLMRRLDIPILMIFGEKDSLVPVTSKDEVKKLNPKIDINVIKDAGHIPFITDTETVARLITEHVVR